jgi:NTE family protein
MDLKRLSLITLLFSLVHLALAQDEPKIGLVLSGGGARGMAHIGVLKVLEEAGIYPDFITGTSMGSVVGGLYALGYTADELDSITKTADWNVILSNDIDYRNVAYEEKEYFGRYLLELPTEGLTPSLPKGVLDGQNLFKLFSDLTRPAHDIHDFDSLPIPYRAIATDIETGKSVTLSKGSLTNSIRASMAIPSVFTPVEIDGKLLVDGGLVRNFPVTEAKDLGADIIIGVFVSTDLNKKEDLESLVDILFQSSFVMSAYDSREQTELVDFYIEPNLDGYSSSSFNEADSIVSRGYQSAIEFRERFERLYDSLTLAGKTFKKPERLPMPESYLLNDIRVNGNMELSDEFIKGRLPVKEGVRTSLVEIDKAVDRIYGTRYFSKVGYNLFEAEDGKFDLVFNVEEKESHQLKFAVHYNNEIRAGINLNYTSRNNLLPNSRFVAEVDLAENVRIDLSYLKYSGKRQLSAVSLNYDYINSILPIFSDNLELANFSHNRHDAFIRFQSTNRPDMSIGIDYLWSFSDLKPRVTESLDFIKRADILTNTIKLFYEYITFNKPFLPMQGVDFRFEMGTTLLNNSEVKYNDRSTPDEEDIVDEAFRSENFYFARLVSTSYIPFSSNVSLVAEADLIYTSSERTGINHQYGIGGFYNNYILTTSFWGAQFYQYSADNFLKLALALQFKTGKNLYFKIQGNYLDSRYPLYWIEPNTSRQVESFDGDPSLLGYGIGIAFNSILGPLQFNVGSTEKTDQFRFGLGIGYWY